MPNTTKNASSEPGKTTPWPLKLIRNHKDHKEAMARMLELMSMELPESCPESEEMEILGLLIQRYEKKHFAMPPSNPIDVIKFMMDQQGLKKKDLIPYIGSAPKVTEVLNGTRRLSLSLIRKLSEGLGIPASVLIQEPVRRRA